MSILTIVLIVVAIWGIYWAAPQLPRPGPLIVAVIVIIVCIGILLNIAGYNTGLHL